MPPEQVLYIGTDISEAINRTRLYDSSGEEVGRGVESANDLPGSQRLAEEALRRAARIGAVEIRWGMEATNLFWWHLACFLSTHPDLVARGLKLYTFNPRVVAKLLESYEDLGKSDWIDAMVIADRLRFGRVPAQCYLDERYQPLQRLTRYRRHLVSQLVREKQVALGYVCLKLSAYGLEQPLSNTFGATSQVLLESYPTPDEIVAAPLEELAGVITAHSRGRIAHPEDVAKSVQRAARRSYRLPKGMVEPVNLVLTSSLQTIRTLGAQLKPLDKTIGAGARRDPAADDLDGSGCGAGVHVRDRCRDRRHSALDSEESTAKFAGLTWRRLPVRRVRGRRPTAHQDRQRIPALLLHRGGQLGAAPLPGVRFPLRQEVRRGDPPPSSPGAGAHGSQAGEAGRLHAASGRIYQPQGASQRT